MMGRNPLKNNETEGNYRQPGAFGCTPHPPAVAFTLRRGAGLLTTVPSFVLPWAVHSQKPPTGILVGQVSFPAWHVLACAVPMVSAAMVSMARLRPVMKHMGWPLIRLRQGCISPADGAPAQANSKREWAPARVAAD
jgi:hypothetical protein